MRGERGAIESGEASACFSARRCTRWVLSLSSWTFTRRTATFSATTPASRTATSTIQTTPPATPRRACGRRFGADFGRGRERGRGAGSAGAASLQEAMALLLAPGLDRGAQPRRRGARVRRQLCRRRLDRPARERPQLRLVPADADREVGRAGTALLARAQEALHDPVLERVEADHGEAAAGAQHLERLGQRGFERAELVVHGDPQRLED